jgi:hypothetical protein
MPDSSAAGRGKDISGAAAQIHPTIFSVIICIFILYGRRSNSHFPFPPFFLWLFHRIKIERHSTRLGSFNIQ